jgi:hypothetical protein
LKQSAIAKLLMLSIKTVRNHHAHIEEEVGPHDRIDVLKHTERMGMLKQRSRSALKCPSVRVLDYDAAIASSHSWLPVLTADVVNFQQTSSRFSGARGILPMLHFTVVRAPRGTV